MRSRLIFPFVLGAIAIWLIGPSTSAAANCPPGQTGNPPYCVTPPPTPPPTPTPTPTPPPPAFVVTNTGVEPSGDGKITLTVPGAGNVTLKGKAIKTVKVTVKGGKVIVTVRPTGKVLQQLRNKGWTRRKQIFVTYIAADGSTVTQKVVIRFKKKTKKGNGGKKGKSGKSGGKRK